MKGSHKWYDIDCKGNMIFSSTKVQLNISTFCIFFSFHGFLLTGGEFLFISGPVVVAADKAILFKTIFSNEKFAKQAKWYNIQNQKLNEIQFTEDQGNIRRTFGGGDKPTPQYIQIKNDVNKFGAYQLRLENIISNKINVFDQGMLL